MVADCACAARGRSRVVVPLERGSGTGTLALEPFACVGEQEAGWVCSFAGGW